MFADWLRNALNVTCYYIELASLRLCDGLIGRPNHDRDVLYLTRSHIVEVAAEPTPTGAASGFGDTTASSLTSSAVAVPGAGCICRG